MDLFYKQFVGVWTKYILIGAAAIHLLAFFGRDTVFEPILLIILTIGILVLAWYSLPAGLTAAFVEVFIGGHGHLLDVEIFGFSLSLRMAIFAAIMLIWLIRVLQRQIKPKIIALRDVPWLLLLIAVIGGTVVGLINQNDLMEIFDDMNGYVVIGYLLPIISIDWSQQNKRDLLQALFGSALWLAIFTLILSFLFTHLDGKSLHQIYSFVRDSRLAEITLQTVTNNNGEVTNKLFVQLFGAQGYWYRIFMQSQFYSCVALIMTITAMFFIWRDQRMSEFAALMAVLTGSTLILSMSRSFALGVFSAGVLIFLAAFFFGSHSIKNIARRSLVSIVLVVVAFALAWSTIVFPFPKQPNISDAAFYETSADASRELAVSSRWQLLGPMMAKIYSSPIIGSGFGTEVTYITDDPRIREIIPSGELTTYRFEWGYQDIWLKMGLLGLVAFVWYIVSIIIAAKYSIKKHGSSWLIVALCAGLIVLFVTHIFSPFLNHPIGLVYMLFILPFIDFQGWTKKAREPKKLIELKTQPAHQMSPAVFQK